MSITSRTDKFRITSFSLLLSVVFIHSIITCQPITTYGVKAGMVLASQQWSGDQSYWTGRPLKQRMGIDLGIFYECPITSSVSISPEIHYNQKGIQGFWGIDELRIGLSEIHADYFSIPVLAKMWLLDCPLSPYVIVGPRLGVRVHTSAVGFDDIWNPFEEIDIGATLGAGFDLRSDSPGRFGLEFRYSPSFNDAYNFGFEQMRNNSMELLLVWGI